MTDTKKTTTNNKKATTKPKKLINKNKPKSLIKKAKKTTQTSKTTKKKTIKPTSKITKKATTKPKRIIKKTTKKIIKTTKNLKNTSKATKPIKEEVLSLSKTTNVNSSSFGNLTKKLLEKVKNTLVHKEEEITPTKKVSKTNKSKPKAKTSTKEKKTTSKKTSTVKVKTSKTNKKISKTNKKISKTIKKVKAENKKIPLTKRVKKCKKSTCREPSVVGGYCRYHYIASWKTEHIDAKIKNLKALEEMITSLSNRFAEEYINLIILDLSKEESFKETLTAMNMEDELYEPEDDTETVEIVEKYKKLLDENK